MTELQAGSGKPRFLLVVILASLLLALGANLALLPLQARNSSAPLAPSASTGLITGPGAWVWQNPLPQGNSLGGVSCPSLNVCFAVGTGGATILKTPDGGATWASVASGFYGGLFNISCPTTLFCLATSIGGFVVATNDGGTTWAVKTSISDIVNSSICPGPNICYAVGSKIVATTDGGNTWVTQLGNLSDSLFSLSCPDTNTCYAVGGNGLIVGTKDAGKSWNRLSYKLNPYYWNISCPALDTCYVLYKSSTSGIVKTTDGGNSWNPTSLSTSDNYDALNCPSSTVCYLAGGDAKPYYGGIYIYNNGRLIKTQDGGNTWTPQFSGLNSSFYSINCPDSSNCVGVGSYGLIVTVNDGGATWTVRNSGLTNFLSAVSCPQTSSCVSVGISGTILTTTDFGSTWISQTSGTTRDLKSVSCPTPASCVMVGLTGTVLTGVPGSTWTLRNSGVTTNLNGISCPDANHCYAVGDSGFILFSADGGISWNPQASPATANLNAVSCVANTNSCFAVGDTNTILSNSGGTWVAQSFSYPGSSADFRSISCPASQDCFAVAKLTTYPYSTFVLTTNGGVSWNYRAGSGSYEQYSISCFNSLSCYSAGQHGTIFWTSDGGTNWNLLVNGTQNQLYGISCVSPGSCTMVGEGGTILTNQLIVTKPVDNGVASEYGTLYFALSNAVAGQNIGFSVPGNMVTVNSANLPPLRQGVNLLGGSCANPVTLDLQGRSGLTLSLSGRNLVQNLKLIHVKDSGLSAKGNGSILKCVKIQR